jgi:hypothetical protein
MIQQQTTIQPLNDEQDMLLEKLKKEKSDISMFVIRTVLHILQIFLYIWVQIFLNSKNISIPLYLKLCFTILVIANLYVVINHFNDSHVFRKQVKSLLPSDSPTIVGVLTKAIVIGGKKNRDIFVASLTPLLYSITSEQAKEAFTEEHTKMLRAIATKPYWRKQEPDLVAAALVGLVALNDNESKQTLENLAQRKWTKSEAWVGDAAKMCLAEWGKR